MTVPQITALPDPPSRQDPTNFAVKGDAFLGALPNFATEANSLATQVNERVDAAFAAGLESAAANATNAANSAASALTQRNLAETAKTGAQQERIAAELARDEAEAFAGLAQATNPLEALQVNRAVITTNQTLTKGFNALSAGPIEIADGVTVTIEETSTWSIA
jgi:hypothetical protein